jgi:hypothetical protein
MAKRPPAPIRVLVLLACLTALGGVVCARSSKPTPTTEHFNATKAPANIFPPADLPDGGPQGQVSGDGRP